MNRVLFNRKGTCFYNLKQIVKVEKLMDGEDESTDMTIDGDHVFLLHFADGSVFVLVRIPRHFSIAVTKALEWARRNRRPSYLDLYNNCGADEEIHENFEKEFKIVEQF